MVLTTNPPHADPIAEHTEVYVKKYQAPDKRGEGQVAHTAAMSAQSHTILDSVQIR